MYILGKVLSILPLDAIIASLNRVVGPCVEELRALCTSREPDAQTKTLLITRLKMLATLCTTLDMRVTSGEDSEADEASTSGRQALAVHQQPVLLIAQQLLPFLKGVVDHWGADEQITEVLRRASISTCPFSLTFFSSSLAVYLSGCEAHSVHPYGGIIGFPA